MIRVGGEILRGISKSSLITTATGIGAGLGSVGLAAQDLGMNASRVGLDAKGIAAGALMTGVGAIMILQDRRDSRRTQP